MSTIAPIDATPAMPPRDQPQRSAANFGAAVTHRDAVRDKQRVDPTSLADKKARAQEARQSDPPREDGRGQHVDIEV